MIEQMRESILRGVYKPGDRIASEKELVDQFHVSKASMREALRALELMGLVEIRKGLGGGIFAAEADMKQAVLGLSNFLHFRNVSIHDVTMARYLIEPQLVQIAALKVDQNDIEVLRDLPDHQKIDPGSQHSAAIGFHRYIARFSENPLVILLMDFIDSLLMDIKLGLQLEPGFHRDTHDEHVRIVECFRRRDPQCAREQMIKHILRVGDSLSEMAGVPAFKPSEIGGAGARVDQLEFHFCHNSPEGVPAPLINKGSKDSGITVTHVGSGDLYLVRAEGGARDIDAESAGEPPVPLRK